MADLSSVTEAEQRAAVIAEARTWIGTPWAHGSDVKGGGVDCGMLLIRVFKDTGVVPDLPDPRPYARHWYLHKDDDRYLRFLGASATEIMGPPDGSEPQPGDIVAWKTGRTYGHAAIVTNWPHGIHSYLPERMVTESDLTQQSWLSGRERKFFTVWPK